MTFLPTYILYPLIFIASLLLSLISIPKVIYIAKRKRLFDVPDNKRKVHVTMTPNLGGIGIFFAFIVSNSFFNSGVQFPKWHYILTSCLILFLTGLYDDLVGINPSKKFLAQFVASLITVIFADIRITSLQGILGIYELPLWISIAFTVVGSMFVTNAINLIDGIDGLAGSITMLCSFLLGLGLAATGNVGPACTAFGLTGAVVGFLRYNISPAKIFMGDTGSLFMGFVISILAVLFVNSYSPVVAIKEFIHSQQEALIVALAILFVPVFDSFRVFINRARKGGSPFKADRTHLHHLLIDAGFTHSESVTILLISNILIITIAMLIQDINPNLIILCILAFALGLFSILYIMRKNRLAKNRELIERRNKVLINKDQMPANIYGTNSAQ